MLWICKGQSGSVEVAAEGDTVEAQGGDAEAWRLL